MKILLVHNYYQLAGGEDAVVAAERDLLKAHGHDVELFTVNNEDLRKMNFLDKIFFVLGGMFNHQHVLHRLEEKIDSFSPDIVHIHNIFYLITPGIYPLLKCKGLPVVQTLHNYRFFCAAGTFYRRGKVCEDCVSNSSWAGVKHQCFKKSAWMSWMIKRIQDHVHHNGFLNNAVHQIIVLSPFSYKKFALLGLPSQRMQIKYNFMEAGVEVKATQRSGFVFVGGLHDYKGVDVLIEAWRLLTSKPRLDIIGEGPEQAALKQMAQDISEIHFLGSLPSPEVYDKMRAAQGVIVPSKCYEHFPRVIAEAYAQGTPVVASRLGALADLVEASQTGFLFESGNAQALATIIEHWPIGEAWDQMSLEAKKKYVSQFSQQGQHEALMKIYQQAKEICFKTAATLK